MGLNLFKLEKLKIKAYEKKSGVACPQRPSKPCSIPVPSNSPTRLSGAIRTDKAINSSGLQVEYTRSKPEHLDIDLLLDGTGVDQMGVAALKGSKTVNDRVKEFLDATFRYNGNIHEPNYLVVAWGSLIFSCRLESVDITYTSFDRDGTPLRAELKASFISDKEAKRLAKEENKKSPDLTHSRVAVAGDTLPLLTNAVYGSSAYYLDVARFNGLDDFRSLTAGQQILFPPLESLISGR